MTTAAFFPEIVYVRRKVIGYRVAQCAALRMSPRLAQYYSSGRSRRVEQLSVSWADINRAESNRGEEKRSDISRKWESVKSLFPRADLIFRADEKSRRLGHVVSVYNLNRRVARLSTCTSHID